MTPLPIFGTLLVTLAVVFPPAAVGEDRYGRRMLVEDEIKRHVVDECDLFLRYGKHRIDFSPDEAALAIAEIHQERRRDRAELVRQIYSVVGRLNSFYRRTRAYDVYYGLCVERVSPHDAEIMIVSIVEEAISDEIRMIDDAIRANFDSRDHGDRAQRDRSRIAIMQIIDAQASETYIAEKNRSVIQEYRFDIELWEYE